MIKGTIYMNEWVDATRLANTLVENDYSVQIKKEPTIDDFETEYRIDYKRKDEFDE